MGDALAKACCEMCCKSLCEAICIGTPRNPGLLAVCCRDCCRACCACDSRAGECCAGDCGNKDCPPGCVACREEVCAVCCCVYCCCPEDAARGGAAASELTPFRSVHAPPQATMEREPPGGAAGAAYHERLLDGGAPLVDAREAPLRCAAARVATPATPPLRRRPRARSPRWARSSRGRRRRRGARRWRTTPVLRRRGRTAAARTDVEALEGSRAKEAVTAAALWLRRSLGSQAGSGWLSAPRPVGRGLTALTPPTASQLRHEKENPAASRPAATVKR